MFLLCFIFPKVSWKSVYAHFLVFATGHMVQGFIALCYTSLVPEHTISESTKVAIISIRTQYQSIHWNLIDWSTDWVMTVDLNDFGIFYPPPKFFYKVFEFTWTLETHLAIYIDRKCRKLLPLHTLLQFRKRIQQTWN